MKTDTSIFQRFPQLNEIPKGKYPKHIMIIPDGNGRWAQAKNQFVLEGHAKAVKVIDTLLRDINEIAEIKIITIWAFSADNWKRSEREVKELFKLTSFFINNHLRELHKRNGRFIHIGRKDRIPKELLKTITNAELKTRKNTGQILGIAIDFGGEDQQLRLLEKVKKMPGKIDITLDLLWKLRDGQGEIPPADLMIRTSGEIRTSDVGWLNGAPTELYFINKLFPDVETSDIVEAIIDFSRRERRMGSRPSN